MAPRPASEEDASLQVGPESDWRLACCSCAPVDAITAGPPMVTSTATPVPATDWHVTSALNAFVGSRAGCLESLHWFRKFIFSVFCDGLEEARYWRERRCNFSAPRNRRAGCMTCGPGPPCQRLDHRSKPRGHKTAGRLHAPCAAVRFLDCWLRRRWKGV